MSNNKTQYVNADSELDEELNKADTAKKTDKKKKKNQNKALKTIKHVFGVIGTTRLSLFMIVIIT